MVLRTVFTTVVALGVTTLGAVQAVGEEVEEPVLDRRVLYQVVEHDGRYALDSSAYGNHGKLKGAVTRLRGAYRFSPVRKDGVFDFIRARHREAFNPGPYPFSYGVRVKIRPDAKWMKRGMTLIRHGDSDTPGGNYKLELRRLKDGTVDAQCEIQDGLGAFGYIQDDGLLDSIADGRWHTIECARVDVDTISLTVDGFTRERPTKGDLGPIVGWDPLLIGIQPFARRPDLRWVGQFHGLLDDIHLTVQVPSVEPTPAR